ncbi:hypothetical protein [Gardnerella greenwoodii]|uniref:Uncharacterized protein n=1 Tax=Gardnerella greenwoodii TaxID=2914925 RepID=A0A2N6RYP8_9BIFI|nr:hypothetical protein [Gardnerella greenwoodii]MDF0753431.1 DUF4423 domain-containing protein [Gardnerella greenwoodii]PMC43153.1 hypothetical protein CJ216_03485 [Gardnerella greenwoodii]
MSNKNADKEKIPRIVKKIRDYRKDKINPILKNGKNTDEVKEKLVEELQNVRFYYNLLNGFSSGFVLGFLSGFIGLLAGFVKPEANLLNICLMGLIFLAILLCQWFFLCKANTAYEKMKAVEDELEKINNPAQSNPKK